MDKCCAIQNCDICEFFEYYGISPVPSFLPLTPQKLWASTVCVLWALNQKSCDYCCVCCCSQLLPCQISSSGSSKGIGFMLWMNKGCCSQFSEMLRKLPLVKEGRIWKWESVSCLLHICRFIDVSQTGCVYPGTVYSGQLFFCR